MRSYIKYSVDGRPLEVYEADLETRQYWNSHIQPYIERADLDARGLLRLGGTAESQAPIVKRVRADSDWNWVRGRIPQSALVAKKLNQLPEFLAVGHVAPSGETFPLGLLLLANRFPWPLEQGLHCTFVWYLSEAIEDAQTAKSIRPFKMLGRTLLDLACCRSVVLGNEGRVLLHAAPAGEARLLEWYRDRLSMKALEPKIRPSALRGNDGRYFYFDNSDTESFLLKQDNLRSKQ